MNLGDLSSYSLRGLFPFDAEIYAGLFELHNEAVWPAQLLALLLGLVALWQLARHRRRGRVVAVTLALAWAFVGWSFHLERYAGLNWAATYIGWAFIAQAALLLAWGSLGRLDAAPESTDLSIESKAGLGLVVMALLAFPFLAPLFDRSWAGAEIFGVAPDPTVVATLGFALAAERTPAPVLIVPLLWCLVSGATALALGLPTGYVTAAAGASTLTLALSKWLRRR